MTTDERSLATWLADRDDAALARTFGLRSVSPNASWSDFFDAAEALLDPASVDRALVRLPRRALAALASGDSDSERAGLERLALLDATGTPFTTVAERVAAARAGTTEAFVAEAAPSEPSLADHSASAAAAERAFASIGALADLLIATLHTPLSRTGAGPVSAADRKRLTDAGAIASPEDLDDLVAAAAASGLLTETEREWIAGDGVDAWLQSSTTRRWAVVVEGLRDTLRPGLRTPGGGFVTPAAWPSLYPLDPEWPAISTRTRRLAERWGLVTPEGAEPAWARTLRLGEPADAASLAELLPAEIDRIYLQADLSAIAPGPLAPALDLRLRRIAVRESRAQASTYRFTAESLVAGMSEGETAESVRAFLSELSLTGIPQPLEYLITSTAGRHGLVRIGLDAHGNTSIESADRGLLNAIEVDQALRPLGLVRDGSSLVTRAARDVVYWSLADARYPVVAVDERGGSTPIVRRRPARGGKPAAEPSFAPLIARLRQSHDTDSDAAWLGRELDQAVRARAIIEVVVRLPGGEERTFTLEATGLGGGRLRGRDRSADIERTLPVSSIVTVRPA
ncbi:helicase-associated domain-containing protein [Microbacterium sp. SS28]|uniref:helicase-associated domain-containing protein n=1 Tax=Microbacterium sp. SS28 TaxID=2919948 RepID=UPI001FAA543F|nr:helicase-associated domain-containing protein [Microbacterium sp. SS28]